MENLKTVKRFPIHLKEHDVFKLEEQDDTWYTLNSIFEEPRPLMPDESDFDPMGIMSVLADEPVEYGNFETVQLNLPMDRQVIVLKQRLSEIEIRRLFFTKFLGV
jgi:hypothetical protein